MAICKLVQINFESIMYQYNICVFSILYLAVGCILISNLLVADLFMHSLSGMTLFYLVMFFFTPKVLLHEISSFCKASYIAIHKG